MYTFSPFGTRGGAPHTIAVESLDPASDARSDGASKDAAFEGSGSDTCARSPAASSAPTARADAAEPIWGVISCSCKRRW
mmetsp:Transcript_6485/g.20696  ORF Transcript_6485/g.20696 Transcript_6485/m.20696 type:complete len:80 (-) Transcript_6485:1613-1852(-)